MSLNAYDVAHATAQARPLAAQLQNPVQLDLEVGLRESILKIAEADDPENTKRSMEPKIKEYFEFCQTVYPNDPNTTILAPHKLYRFMYYQAFREKKPVGGRRSDNANKPAFDVDAYHKVIANLVDPNTGVPTSAVPTPKDPVKPSTFALYKATMRRIFGIQKARQHLAIQWDDLWTNHLNLIHKIVKQRTPKIKKQTYAEKVTSEFQPYLFVDRYPDIEKELWWLAIASSTVVTAKKWNVSMMSTSVS